VIRGPITFTLPGIQCTFEDEQPANESTDS